MLKHPYKKREILSYKRTFTLVALQISKSVVERERVPTVFPHLFHVLL